MQLLLLLYYMKLYEFLIEERPSGVHEWEVTMKVEKKSMTLYAVTDRHWLQGRKLADQVEDICKAGITFLQLREKEFTHEEMVAEAKEIKKIAEKYQVPFVINDDIYAAKEIDADGVHIGQSDMAYEQARAILGEEKIIGVSAGNLEEALAAQEAGADYIGVGAVFHTDTKSDTRAVTHEQLKEICDHMTIPVVAIGGIGEDNALQLKGTGIDGIAVISAIFANDDPRAAASRLKKLAEEITNE